MSNKSNEFQLIGRVGYIKIEYLNTGTALTTINIGVKNHKKEYDNFFIKFFNNKKHNTAEILAESVTKGDYIRVSGALSISKFTPRNSDKEIEKTELIGWGFKKVEWVDNGWVDLENNQSQTRIEGLNDDDLIGEDEIPF